MDHISQHLECDAYLYQMTLLRCTSHGRRWNEAVSNMIPTKIIVHQLPWVVVLKSSQVYIIASGRSHIIPQSMALVSNEAQPPSFNKMANSLPSFDDSLGALFVGGICSSMWIFSFGGKSLCPFIIILRLYGTTTMQTFTYYLHSQKDAPKLKIVVRVQTHLLSCSLILTWSLAGRCCVVSRTMLLYGCQTRSI